MFSFFKKRPKKPSQTYSGYDGAFSMLPRYTTPIERNTAEWVAYFSKSPRLAVVERIASDLSFASGKLYQIDEDGNEQEIQVHPFLTFWKRANPLYEFSTAALWRLFEIYLLLKGEGYFIIEKDILGQPKELWSVPVQWVQMTPYEGYPFYNIRTTGGMVMDVSVDDMFVMKDLNPFDPFRRGLGQSESIADEIEIDEYAAKFQKAFFSNSGTLGTILSIPEGTSEQGERFLSKLEQRHKGIGNNHKMAIIPDKAEVLKMNDTMKDMDMIQGRTYLRDAVLEHFGVPREIMGITESSNRATSDAAQFIYAQNVLMPKLRRREEAINTQLIPLFGENLVWRFDDIVPHNQEFDKAKALEGWNSGLLTKNEARKLMDLDETENGDVFKTTFSDIYLSESEDPTETSYDLAEMQFIDDTTPAEEETSIEQTDPLPQNLDSVTDEVESEAPEAGGEIAEEVAVASEVSLNGAQISSLISIVQAVNNGELTYHSATEIIMSAFPFDKEKALSILGDPKEIEERLEEQRQAEQEESQLPEKSFSERRNESKSRATKSMLDAAKRDSTRMFEKAVSKYFLEQGKRIHQALEGKAKADESVWDILKAQLPEQEWQDGSFQQLDESERLKLVDDFVLNLLDWDGEANLLQGIFTPLWKDTYDKGAEAAQKIYHLEGIKRPELVIFSKLKGAQRVTAITETTKADIRKIVSNALETGETNAQITKKIMSTMTTTEKRAKVIAAQECNTSLLKGNFDMMKQAGAKTKTWNITPSSGVRDSHKALNGKTVPIDKPFITENGVKLMHPCDPDCSVPSEVVNCHCHLSYDEGR